MSSYPPPPPGDQPPGGYGAPPPPPGYGGYGADPYGYGPPQSSKKAVWALVLGILSLVCCGIFSGIPAIWLGSTAKKEIDASGGRLTGRGLAQAGFVIGIVGTVISLLGLLGVATGRIDVNTSNASPVVSVSTVR